MCKCLGYSGDGLVNIPQRIANVIRSRGYITKYYCRKSFYCLRIANLFLRLILN